MRVHVNDVIKATEGAENAVDALVRQYKAVYPNFDELEVVPFAKASEKTNLKLIQAIIELFPDERMGINMLWMNNGFSVDNTVEDDFIVPAEA